MEADKILMRNRYGGIMILMNNFDPIEAAQHVDASLVEAKVSRSESQPIPELTPLGTFTTSMGYTDYDITMIVYLNGVDLRFDNRTEEASFPFWYKFRGNLEVFTAALLNILIAVDVPNDVIVTSSLFGDDEYNTRMKIKKKDGFIKVDGVPFPDYTFNQVFQWAYCYMFKFMPDDANVRAGRLKIEVA